MAETAYNKRDGGLRLAEYVRVSRYSIGEKLSPALQHQRNAGHAKLHGHRLITPRFEDLDQPGTKYDRPRFQEALAMVEAGKADGIIVSRLDRFARSAIDGLTAIKRIHDAGGHLIIVENGLDTTTPTGRAFMTILLAFAQLEWERIRDNWDEIQEGAVARGIHIGRAPFGYHRTPDKRLIADPAEAAMVKKLFKARAAGATHMDLLGMLRETPGRGSSVAWTTNGVRSLLANPVYLGEARGGNGYRNAGAHKAIVSRDLFDKVQNLRPTARPRNGEGALLAGLIRCAGCRYAMGSTGMYDKRRQRDPDGRRMYRCHGRHASGACTCRAAVSSHLIDEHVEQAFLAAYRGGEVLAESSANEDMIAARARVVAAEAELDAFLTLTPASLDRDLFAKHLEAKQADLDQARAAVDALSATDDLSAFDELDLVAAWPDLSVTERRHVLSAFLDAVIVRKGTGPIEDRVHILYRGEMPADFPSRGKRCGPVAPFLWPADGDAAAR
jgi:DNA invertase Pin-like site-specific DNA recombinase